MTMVTTIVRLTRIARIIYLADKIVLDKHPDIAAATANNLYVMRGKLVLGTLAHVAREHHHNTQLLQIGSNTRLAAATLRRGQVKTPHNDIVFNRKNSIMVAMAKMVIHTTVPCRNSYSHNRLRLIKNKDLHGWQANTGQR